MRVLKSSLLASVQDLGRSGYAHIGLTWAGAMDEYAYNWANLLLDNEYGTNALEIYLGGVEFEILTPTNIVLTGAEVDAYLNGVKIPLWKSVYVRHGDKLSIGFAKKGNIIYLGVKGGFEAQKLYGSFSYSQKEGQGRVLKLGDELVCSQSLHVQNRKLKDEFVPKYKEELLLRISPSYQYENFSKENIKRFLISSYEVSAQTNRMGVRLKGEALENVQTKLISEGICFGAVQIPSDGQPIVLLKERQSIGGYPKIGTVLALDCFKLAQAKVGTKIRFELIDFKKAKELMREFYADFSSN